MGFQEIDLAGEVGVFTLRNIDDELPQSWWFASTAIPLLVAAMGPLANLLSIAALVTTWKDNLANNGGLSNGAGKLGTPISDPKWQIALNAVSLVCGFIGTFFLLMNIIKKVSYIIALPMSILFWFLATGILTAILIAMHVYTPPIGPDQIYSQGFWHAVLASILYWINAVMLTINMFGYFLGKYSQCFCLDDSQRTFILQTILFFFWIAAGAYVFSKLCGFRYVDAVYFCNATLLTIGYHDLAPSSDAGRGFIIPYTLVGIILLGVMINNIRKFAMYLSADKIIKAYALNEQRRTRGRAVANEHELRERLGLPPRSLSNTGRPSDAGKVSTVNGISGRQQNGITRYGHFSVEGGNIAFQPNVDKSRATAPRNSSFKNSLSHDEKFRSKDVNNAENKRISRRQKLLMIREEKDRFDAMRDIQAHTHKFKHYYSLIMAILAFSILFGLGAFIFMLAERGEQDMSYLMALYFCCVALPLLGGYGDIKLKSNAGKPFFIVWSFFTTITLTILVTDMAEAIIETIIRGRTKVANWTVLPRQGAWHDFLDYHPRLRDWIQKIHEKKEEKKRLREGFDIVNIEMDIDTNVPANKRSTSSLDVLTIDQLVHKDSFSDHELARKLGLAIKRVAQDLHLEPPKKYCYEEWVAFRNLIRFSAKCREEVEEWEEEEEEEGLVEWDWIGEDSPMLADVTEAQWLLDRLCESLTRYAKKQARIASKNSIPRVRKHNLRRRLSTQKEEEEEQVTASGSSSSNAHK